ncbi:MULTISPECIES: YdaS family helix-turn-helix protein [unclassified Erythrobacter]|uniref:transcriptional regulator n=1 Tax=unclassified Erythrobacter TaxID=2633097 RepID=UPI0009EF6964
MDRDSNPARKAFLKAHELAGGHSALARICECTPGNIHQLVAKGSVLPGRHVLRVEAATGVPRYELRPDLYPHEGVPAALTAIQSAEAAS